MENTSGQSYWDKRWKSHETGWDIGYPSPAIAGYMDHYENKDAAILIPGCGNAYEAEYIVRCGFTNITLLDIAPHAVEHLKGKFASAPAVKIVCEDFFRHEGHYDLVLEQTFFCALPPGRREDYVKKMSSLLNTNGRLAGVLSARTLKNPVRPLAVPHQSTCNCSHLIFLSAGWSPAITAFPSGKAPRFLSAW